MYVVGWVRLCSKVIQQVLEMFVLYILSIFVFNILIFVVIRDQIYNFLKWLRINETPSTDVYRQRDCILCWYISFICCSLKQLSCRWRLFGVVFIGYFGSLFGLLMFCWILIGYYWYLISWLSTIVCALSGDVVEWSWRGCWPSNILESMVDAMINGREQYCSGSSAAMLSPRVISESSIVSQSYSGDVTYDDPRPVKGFIDPSLNIPDFRPARFVEWELCYDKALSTRSAHQMYTQKLFVEKFTNISTKVH